MLALVAASRWLVEVIGVELYFLPLPIVVALSAVGSRFVHTVHDELNGDVAVLRTLDESVHLSTDLERDPGLESIRRRGVLSTLAPVAVRNSRNGTRAAGRLETNPLERPAGSGLRATRGIRTPGKGRRSTDAHRERVKRASGPTTDPESTALRAARRRTAKP